MTHLLTKTRAAFVAVAFSLTLAFIPAARAQTVDAKSAARGHFQKGVVAFDEHRYAEAADEFEAAYKLSPAFAILYNLGQVDVLLGRSVEAIDAFERYLKLGGAAINPARRQDVQGEMERQLAHVATLRLHVSPNDAEVRLDGTLLAKAAFSGTRVNPGKHVLEAVATGYGRDVRELEASPGATLELALHLKHEAEGKESAQPSAAPTSTVPVAVPAAPAPTVVEPRVAPVTPVVQPAAPVNPPKDDGPVFRRTVIERTFTEAPAAGAPGSAPGAMGSTGTVQRLAGGILVLGGIATATVGAIQAYRGANQADDASHRLATAATGADYAMALPDYNDGRALNRRGWVTAGIGLAMIVGGGVVVATAPSTASDVRVSPWADAHGAGFSVGGIW